MTNVRPDGRITLGSSKAHLESVHPDVVLPSTPSAIDGSSLLDGSGNLSVRFGDSPSIDAFARLRVSNPIGLFDSQLQYDLHRVLWEDSIVNTSGNAIVTHLPNESSANMTVEADDSIIRQSRQYIRYQPGKSQMVLCTFVLGASSTGLTQRVGYFDDDNGIFLELDDDVLYVVLRSNETGTPVDTRVSQTSWNTNTLTGLDITQSQILIIDMEWLGVGRARIGFVIDGIPVYVHCFLNANNHDAIYMTTANLPVRYQIIADSGVVGSHSMKVICSQVSSEGGVEFSRGLPFSAANENTLRSITNASYVPLVSFRPKQTFNSIVNRGLIIPESLTVFSSDRNIHFRLTFGGTLTGASWSSVNDDSITEYDVAATAISGGIQIMCDYVATGSGNNTGGEGFRNFVTLMPLALNIAGAHPTSPYTDSLSISATSLEAQAANCAAALSWRELR